MEWKRAGLLAPSVVKPVFTTIERTLVLRKLGRLQLADQKSLRAAIFRILG